MSADQLMSIGKAQQRLSESIMELTSNSVMVGILYAHQIGIKFLKSQILATTACDF
jgi:hypothetical protein